MNTRHFFALGAAALVIGCNGSSGGGKPPPPPPPPQYVTIDFPLEGFDAVRLGASFEYMIRQGHEHDVTVTIEADWSDDLDVRVDGSTLIVGFRPDADIRSDRMETVITLPDVSRLEISGSADGLVAGFSGNSLEVDVNGNARLEASNLRYDYLSITNNGSATIDFSDVVAIPGADVQLSGSSIATVNLMDFATVTGQMGGSSTLQYYGSSINLQVATNQASRITRLGESR